MMKNDDDRDALAPDALELAFELHRQDPGELAGTPGVMLVRQGDEVIFRCRTLERPWLGNKRNISCIPAGEYRLAARRAGRYYERAKELWAHRYAYHVKGVPDRDYILIHWGNFLRSTRGCILLGLEAQQCTYAGERQCKVGPSKAAYRAFYQATKPFMLAGEQKLVIYDADLSEGEADLEADRSDI